jgi:hypothetical protein
MMPPEPPAPGSTLIYSAAACRQCGAQLIQRNRVLLFVSGLLMCLTPLIAIRIPLLWAPAVILFLAGAYLILWSTIARGLWCRQCKSFRT